MALWGTTATSATNKPKFLTDDPNSPYDKTKVYANNSGWAVRAGSAATGNGNTSATPEILVAIGGLAGTTTGTGLAHPTISNIRWVLGRTSDGAAAVTHGTSDNITLEVTFDEQVKYVAGTAGTMTLTASAGGNLTATVTHIDGTALTDGLTGNTVRLTATSAAAANVTVADDAACVDWDLVDALGANDALSGADATTITAAVKTASSLGTCVVS